VLTKIKTADYVLIDDIFKDWWVLTPEMMEYLSNYKEIVLKNNIRENTRIILYKNTLKENITNEK